MSEWIKCSERLPDNDREVLAWTGNYLYLAVYDRNPHLEAERPMWRTDEWIGIDVIYWLEAPEPPK